MREIAEFEARDPEFADGTGRIVTPGQFQVGPQTKPVPRDALSTRPGGPDEAQS